MAPGCSRIYILLPCSVLMLLSQSLSCQIIERILSETFKNAKETENSSTNIPSVFEKQSHHKNPARKDYKDYYYYYHHD